VSHKGNDELVDQIIDELPDDWSDVIYEVTITSETLETLNVIRQILASLPILMVEVTPGDFEYKYVMGPIKERQITTSKLLEEKLDGS